MESHSNTSLYYSSMDYDYDDDDDEVESNQSSKHLIFGEGKLLIKLKFPKAKEEEEEEKSTETANTETNQRSTGPTTESAAANTGTNQNRRSCPECFKGFSSGKALGGHMRIHAQSAPKKQVRKLKRQQMTTDPPLISIHNNENTDDQSKPTCSLCGRSFPSMKSLFGHMRCHPEREWRGIQPPPTPKTSSSPRSYDYQIDSPAAVDLVKCVPSCWSMTDRRGRKTLRTTSGVLPASIDDNKLRGDLLRLAKFQELVKNCSSAETDVTDGVYGLKKQKTEVFIGSTHSENFSNSISDGTMNVATDKGKGKAVAVSTKGGQEYFPEDYYESDSTNTELLANNNNSSDGAKSLLLVKNKKKRKKGKLMADLESGQEGPNRYKCNICNKSFPSHQALGGHRSSHNKFKVSIINTNIKKNHHHEDEYHQAHQRQVVVAEEEKHQCKICNKSFLTGQALGGHQRCHWTPPQLLAEQPALLVTSSTEASQITGHRVLEFDLNEIPPMEEDNGDSA